MSSPSGWSSAQRERYRRKRSIGGALDQRAQVRLYFSILDHEEQVARLRRLAASGYDAAALSRVTGLDVEQVSKALAEQAVNP